MSHRLSLAARLFVAQLLALLLGAISVGATASLIGPPIFRAHLRRASVMAPEVSMHVEEAFVSAGAISLGIASLVALAAALVVSGYVARRVGRPVEHLADAAAEVAGGRYDVEVAPPLFGAEFGTLAAAFNRMATRLEAVESTRRRILADLAHEMRTPLATIEGYLDAAEDGVAVPNEDSLRVVRDQTARLQRLADDISAVTRAEEQPDLHPRETAPGALIQLAVAAAVGRYAAKDVDLSVHVDASLPTVLADPERIGQVLGNLLDNALRHTPAGGRVTVSAQVRGSFVDLVVADTGEGIGTDHLPHLFERFYRVDPARDRARGGSGIGLAIVRAVVSAHNGRVSADSLGPGHGATFTISLPARREGRVAGMARGARKRGGRRSG